MADSRIEDVLTTLADQRRRIEDLTASIARLIKVIEQNDHLQERAERAEEKERDAQHDEIVAELSNLYRKVVSLRAELITEIYQHLENRVVEALPSSPAPLGEVPVKIKIEHGEPTAPFKLHHKNGERREMQEIVGKTVIWLAQKSWKLVAASGAGATVMHLLHKYHVL